MTTQSKAGTPVVIAAVSALAYSLGLIPFVAHATPSLGETSGVPLHIKEDGPISTGTITSGFCGNFIVPGGKRLVLEHAGVTFSAGSRFYPSIDLVQLSIVDANRQITRHVPLIGHVAPTGRPVISQPITAYAESAESLRVSIRFATPTPSESVVECNLIGRLIDIH